jgi:hypothetical protein
MTGKLSGIAAVLAAVGLSADSKDAVPRDAFNSAITAALDEGKKLGVIEAGNDAAKLTADAVKTANTRTKAILDHSDAKGREDLARHLAFETEMSADAAVAMLGKAPKGAEPKTSRLDGNVPDPKVGSEVEPPAAGEGLSAAVDRLVAAQAKRIV